MVGVGQSQQSIGLSSRVEHTWARSAAAFLVTLRDRQPEWGSATIAIGGGEVVLCGPGMFVNAALAMGLPRAFTPADADVLTAVCKQVGVPMAIEVVPGAHPSVAELCRDRGLVPIESTAVLVAPAMPTPFARSTSPIDIAAVTDVAALRRWQHIAANGWGHDQPARRRASDAFAEAAFHTPGEQLFIANARSDGRELGCAALTIRDGLATLGAMSTLPDERRNGVQAALVHHRRRVASQAGCDVCVSSVTAGGASERNLRRLGFTPVHIKTVWAEPR